MIGAVFESSRQTWFRVEEVSTTPIVVWNQEICVMEFFDLFPQRKCAFRPLHQMGNDWPEVGCIFMKNTCGWCKYKICW